LTTLLSIIVPVRNAEVSLPAQVEHLLEVLPDLTPRFEVLVVLVVDDASTDHTAELAGELARRYPQVRLLRHSQPGGLEAAVQTAAAEAQGRTVLVQEDPAALSATELRRLWSLREDPAHPAGGQRQLGLFDPGLLERLTTWGQALRSHARGAISASRAISRNGQLEP
jgi:glycosyltransferase involved in cell wall biosynthesis